MKTGLSGTGLVVGTWWWGLPSAEKQLIIVFEAKEALPSGKESPKIWRMFLIAK